MPVSLSTEQVAVLARINRSPDGHFFREILKGYLADKDRDCRNLDGPALHRAQGAAQAYASLLENLEAAPAKADQLLHRGLKPNYQPNEVA